MAIDWFDIDIDGAIGQLGHQAVVLQCEDGVQIACDLVTRNPADNRIVLVGDLYINVDQETASGIDFEVDYTRDVDWLGASDEYIGFRLLASHLMERSEQNAGGSKIDRAGQTGWQQSDGVPYALPEWKWVANMTYGIGSLSAFLQARYISEGTSENALDEGVNIDDNSVDSAFYMDLDLRYLIEFDGDLDLELFANVQNLTDEDPPITPYHSVFFGYSRQDNPLLFDVLGRRYTLGFRMSFE